MKHFLFINTACFALLVFTQNIFAQNPDPNSFFPHSVGNIWEYNTPTGIVRYNIRRDSIGSNGQIYLFFGAGIFDPLWSIDTASSTVYYSPKILNWQYYKLDADSGETWMVYPEDTIPPGAIQRREALVINKYPWFIFGTPTEFMEIEYYDLNWGDTIINEFAWKVNTETLASGFGLIEDFIEEPPHIGRLLRGCVLDGDTFGIITSVEDIIKSPEDFYLLQNFPNPFNPTTTINYSLKTTGEVTLKVYDMLGTEVASLVNERQEAGNYSVIFYAVNLPSGIYFYTLTSGNFTASKKLILLK